MNNKKNPVKIVETLDWFNYLKEFFSKKKISKPLFVVSKGNIERLNLKNKFREYKFYIYSGTNPNIGDCEAALDFCKNENFDGIISIGGGSTMDLSKVIKFYLLTKIKNVKELINSNEIPKTKIPTILIPTTHGSGSEVTKWGTVWDIDNQIKYSISNDCLYSDIALLDPNLVLSLPLDISITTTMDALSHSFESIWNKNVNNLSKPFAIEAICKIIKNIDLLKKTPKNVEVRKIFLLASCLAGQAISYTTTAASHSISYPLTFNFNIPHGIASSLALVPLLEINKNEIQKDIDVICNKLGLQNITELKEKIKKIPIGIIPFSLREWKVKKSDFTKIVSQSFTKGRMNNNVVDLSSGDVLKIINLIY